MNGKRISWAAMISLLAVVTANAADLTLTASRTAAITSASGEGRVLLAFSGLSTLREEWVSQATLTVPLAGRATTGRGVTVEVDALTRTWGAGATWTSPWTTAGGDRVERLANSTELRPGAAAVTVDVTDMVRAMAEGDLAENGFVLLPGTASRAGFSATELALFEGAGGATLTVHYRKLTALGYRGGPQALAERKRVATQ